MNCNVCTMYMYTYYGNIQTYHKLNLCWYPKAFLCPGQQMFYRLSPPLKGPIVGAQDWTSVHKRLKVGARQKTWDQQGPELWNECKVIRWRGQCSHVEARPVCWAAPLHSPLGWCVRTQPLLGHTTPWGLWVIRGPNQERGLAAGKASWN